MKIKRPGPSTKVDPDKLGQKYVDLKAAAKAVSAELSEIAQIAEAAAAKSGTKIGKRTVIIGERFEVGYLESRRLQFDQEKLAPLVSIPILRKVFPARTVYEFDLKAAKQLIADGKLSSDVLRKCVTSQKQRKVFIRPINAKTSMDPDEN